MQCPCSYPRLEITGLDVQSKTQNTVGQSVWLHSKYMVGVVGRSTLLAKFGLQV